MNPIKKYLALFCIFSMAAVSAAQNSKNSLEIGLGLNARFYTNSFVKAYGRQPNISLQYNLPLKNENLHLIGNLSFSRLIYVSTGLYEPRPLFIGAGPYNYATYNVDFLSLNTGLGYQLFSIKRFELVIESTLGYTNAISGQIFNYNRYSLSNYEFEMSSFNYNLNVNPRIRVGKKYTVGLNAGITDYFNRKLESKRKEFNYKKPLYIQIRIGREITKKSEN